MTLGHLSGYEPRMTTMQRIVLVLGAVGLLLAVWTAPRFVRAGIGGVMRFTYDPQRHRGQSPEIDFEAVAVRGGAVLIGTWLAFVAAGRNKPQGELY